MPRPRAYRPLEKDVERQADRLCALYGFVAVRFSQARATMQTPGIPDRRYYHPSRGVSFWYECKRPGGKQSPAQRAFQAMCEACGEVYILDDGTLAPLAAHLTSIVRAA